MNSYKILDQGQKVFKTLYLLTTSIKNENFFPLYHFTKYMQGQIFHSYSYARSNISH